MLVAIKKLAKRSKGMEALQAVILIGAAFVITWGLMTVWGEVKNDVKDTASSTIKGTNGASGGGAAGGGGGGGK